MQDRGHRPCEIHQPTSYKPDNDAIRSKRNRGLCIEVYSGATIEEIHTFALPLWVCVSLHECSTLFSNT